MSGARCSPSRQQAVRTQDSDVTAAMTTGRGTGQDSDSELDSGAAAGAAAAATGAAQRCAAPGRPWASCDDWPGLAAAQAAAGSGLRRHRYAGRIRLTVQPGALVTTTQTLIQVN
jgi:hypothetical protein